MSRSLAKTGLSHLLSRLLFGPAPVLHHSSRSFQTLAFEEIKSSPEKPHEFTAFVLHGLLGSGRNWRSFSRSLASRLSPAQWRMILVDLRNHGRSAEIEGLLPPHNLENAAKDLADLVKSEDLDWPDVVIGHSMGGKVALQFAQSCANGHYGDDVTLPKQLWVLDSVPGKVIQDNTDGEVEKVLQTLQSLPSTLPSRKWLVDHMLKLGFSKSLSEWIGSNLKKSGEQETWAFNLDGAVQMFNSYREMDYWPLLDHTPKGMEIDVVRAEKSDRWNQDVIQQLEHLSAKGVNENEGKVLVHVLPNAGHWVHVDNPKGLLDIIAPKVASIV
ncbi:protein ABHD11 isoform X1 [Sesamum indicum]|uniref:Protein ABHD11 isoform X1 n=1 Tax=Sesamum indicum TaxID=4182 RepID=A0A6I9U9I5_SESIN|nr:protein ABHD11 isoform X1 [Sesamum indicum]